MKRTNVLKSNISDYNDAYILVRGDITVIVVIAAPTKQVAFKNYAIFTIRITKTDGTTIDDAEDLYLVLPMFNLIEYSPNYFETTGSLWFYSKHEATGFNVDITNDNNLKSFEYKTKLSGNTAAAGANGILKNARISVPLNYLSNFWRSLEMLLINFKAELKPK